MNGVEYGMNSNKMNEMSGMIETRKQNEWKTKRNGKTGNMCGSVAIRTVDDREFTVFVDKSISHDLQVISHIKKKLIVQPIKIW